MRYETFALPLTPFCFLAANLCIIRICFLSFFPDATERARVTVIM